MLCRERSSDHWCAIQTLVPTSCREGSDCGESNDDSSTHCPALTTLSCWYKQHDHRRPDNDRRWVCVSPAGIDRSFRLHRMHPAIYSQTGTNFVKTLPTVQHDGVSPIRTDVPRRWICGRQPFVWPESGLEVDRRDWNKIWKEQHTLHSTCHLLTGLYGCSCRQFMLRDTTRMPWNMIQSIQHVSFWEQEISSWFCLWNVFKLIMILSGKSSFMGEPSLNDRFERQVIVWIRRQGPIAAYKLFFNSISYGRNFDEFSLSWHPNDVNDLNECEFLMLCIQFAHWIRVYVKSIGSIALSHDKKLPVPLPNSFFSLTVTNCSLRAKFTD